MAGAPRLALSRAFVGPPPDDPPSFYVSPAGDLAVVIAPVGKACSETSRLALSPFRGSRDDDAPAEWLANLVLEANRNFVAAARARHTERRARHAARRRGATVAAVLIDGTSLHVAHAGDVRVYLLRDGRAERLTDDHTLENAFPGCDVPSHAILRALGMDGELVPGARTVDVAEGDTVLLCTNSVYAGVPEAHMAMLFATQRREWALRELLRRATGPDDATAVALGVTAAQTAPADARG